jgi:rSAM/selenodomain-associated transferase 1
MNDVLLVFAKVPRPGEVKTRLTPFLSPQEAARLYDAFLRDALNQYTRLEVDVQLHLAPPLPEEGFDVEGDDRISIHGQEGADLGARMAHALETALETGHERAVLIGTDHPTLPLAFVRRAFSSLEADDSICIGPSDDGGFYLLGMTAVYPRLFEGMSYSHDRVFTETLARMGTTDAALTVLPGWYDVDTPEALHRLLDDLENPRIEAPATRAVIEDLDLRARS